MRSLRVALPFSFTLALSLGVYACDNGTFSSALSVYDPDAGPPTGLLDSSVPTDAQTDGQAPDGGDASVPTDGGDAGHAQDGGDAASATDAGDATSPVDAATDGASGDSSTLDAADDGG